MEDPNHPHIQGLEAQKNQLLNTQQEEPPRPNRAIRRQYLREYKRRVRQEIRRAAREEKSQDG